MLYSEPHKTPYIGSWDLVGDLGHILLHHIPSDTKSILKTEAPLCRTRGPTRSPPSSTHARAEEEWLHCISQRRPHDGAVVLARVACEDAGEREKSLCKHLTKCLWSGTESPSISSCPDLVCVSTPAKTTSTVNPPPLSVNQ